MTLDQLVVYGGIVLGIWLLAVVGLLATHQHRSTLRLRARPPETVRREAPVRASWAGRIRHAFAHR